MNFSILNFELRRQVRQPLMYVYFLLFTALGFLALWRASVGRGFLANLTQAGQGNIEADAPFAIYYFITLISTFALIIAMAWFGDAASRDYKYRTHSLFYSYPMGKFDYLAGRFGGAFAGMLFVSSGIAYGGLLAATSSLVDASGIGNLHLLAFIQPYFLSIIPNFLLAGALFFSIPLFSRQFTSVWVGLIGIVTLNLVGQGLAQTDSKILGAILDPSGLVATKMAYSHWSIAQKNELLIPLTGVLLVNRLIWTSLAVAILVYCWRRFSFVIPEVSESGKQKITEKVIPEKKIQPNQIASALKVAKDFSLGAYMRCLLHLTRDDFGFLTRRKSFYFVVALGLGLMLTIGYNNVGIVRGTQTFPVTSQVLAALTENLYFLGVLMALYCSSALVWRERDAAVHEIAAVLPVPRWVPLFSKILAMSLVQVVMMGLVIVGGIAIQISFGYYHFEPGLYFAELFGVQLVFYILVSIFSIFSQVLTAKKLPGFLFTFFFIDDFMEMFGLHHHLWTFASRPLHQISDMNGYGPFKSAIAAYNLYWISFAVILVVLTLWIIPRGLDTGFKQRWLAIRGRVSRSNRIFLAVGITGCLAMGSFIVYNTVLLNEFETEKSAEAKAVRYEKQFKSWQDKPQAHLTGIQAEVDLFPAQRRVESRGLITLENESNAPIDTLFIQMPHDAMIRNLDLDLAATRLDADQELGVYLFALEEPLNPGDTTSIVFDLELAEPGFKDTAVNTRLVENGLFLTIVHLFPASGYDPYDLDELSDNDRRQKYGLERKPRLAPVSNNKKRMRTLIGDHADWIDFEVTVSTASDQIALAPGDLVKQWEQDGRKYFNYRAQEKILCYAAILSGRYAVRRDTWNGVDIEVYYHPNHESNIDLIVQSVQSSLEYFSREFSPYQFPAVRIVEFPRYEIFAEAFPGLIPLSEGYGFIAKYDDDKVKEAYRVVAHEMGHQWWAHQVIGGCVEGTFLLSEVMAQYSALMISREQYDQPLLDKYLVGEIDRYLTGRSRETEEEVPLVRTNQETWYEHYAKGFVVMNSLVEYIGEDKINAAIRDFIAENAFQEPPFAIAPDLVDHFKAVTPDSMLYLVEDCFDRIVLFDNQALAAECESYGNGQYKVTLSFKAQKWSADGQGCETPMPMHDLIEFAVFDDQGLELARQRRWLEANSMGPITMVVDQIPARAGIDPHRLLMDKKTDNNLIEVKPLFE